MRLAYIAKPCTPTIERGKMDKNDLNLTKRPVDKIVYLPLDSIPEIQLELVEFLEKELPNRFPNLLDGSNEQLIHYQGKLDLIAELRYLYEAQQRPLTFEEASDNKFY